jgi:hypothetical protein
MFLAAAEATAQMAHAATPAATTTGTTTVVGGYGGYTCGEVGTLESSYLHGLADTIRSTGTYNKLSSEAAKNLAEAQRAAMENAICYVETYFRLQQINHDLRFPPGARMSTAEMIRLNKAMGPRPLSPGEFDRASGQIYWPELLQNAYFEPQRTELQNLFTRLATSGGFGMGGYAEVRRAVDVMMDALRDQVKLVPTVQYVDSRRFLEDLAYEAKNPRSAQTRTPLISSLPARPR